MNKTKQAKNATNPQVLEFISGRQWEGKEKRIQLGLISSVYNGNMSG